MHDSGVGFYKERSGLEAHRIKAIVLIKVEHAAELTSPAYDDGSTEAEVAERSLEVYNLTRIHGRTE